MPNILIIGFGSITGRSVQEQVDAIMKKMGELNACTTIIESESKWCIDDKESPYLLVRHTKIGGARKIAIELNKRLKVDVEYEKINGGFIPKPSRRK